jgi:undecaprenyl phosphate N,N'-diacetylbacillosamine 1-phosphate transferase
MYVKVIKPFFDFLISIITVLILSPIILVLALIVYFKLGKPVFFRQSRPGKNEKVFTLYKFRTMTNKLNFSGELLPDIERITKFGSILRKSSLDELPQLFNVLKGDLSLVGPRPLLIEYLPLYNDTQKKRHLVKPGITGWAQINGRNVITWEDKFNFDLFYVEHISFFLDMEILLKTIINVLRRTNINNSTGHTMEKFTGSKL